MHFIIRWIVTALAVAAAFYLVPGISIYADYGTYGTYSLQGPLVAIIVFSLIMALINKLIKPILKVLSAPVTLLTFGLFALVVNTFLFYLAAYFASMLGTMAYIDSFWSAFAASIIISIVTFVLNRVFDD